MRVVRLTSPFRRWCLVFALGLVLSLLGAHTATSHAAESLKLTPTAKTTTAQSTPTPTPTNTHSESEHTDSTMHHYSSSTPLPQSSNQIPLGWKCALPISFSSLVGLLYALYKKYGKIKNLTKDLKDLEKRLLEERKRHKQAKHLEEESRRAAWLAHPPTHFHNALEVSVKLLYPLWQFLGYQDNDLRIGEDVQGQIQSQNANWIVRQGGRAHVVALVQAPGQPLDATSLENAQRLAHVLHADYSLLTNGEEILLLHREGETTEEVLRCDVRNLATCWGTLETYLGAKKATEVGHPEGVISP